MRDCGPRKMPIGATINGHAHTRVRHLFRARLMTPARIAALVVSFVLLIGAAWLVFVGVPKASTPAPTAVAGLPSAGADASVSTSPTNSQSSEVPASPETSLSEDQSTA